MKHRFLLPWVINLDSHVDNIKLPYCFWTFAEKLLDIDANPAFVCSAVTLGDENSSLHVDLVIDPLSSSGQKLASLLQILWKHVKPTMRIVLNPIVSVKSLRFLLFGQNIFSKFWDKLKGSLFLKRMLQADSEGLLCFKKEMTSTRE